MEYTIRGRCGEDGCRETRYYIENGLWFCRQGHQQEGRQVEAGEDDFGNHGRTSRKQDVATPERVSRNYQGWQAYRLFLQAYQLILWKQCHALVQSKGFPEEFEVIVRELWALRLQKLQEKTEDPARQESVTLFSSQQDESQADSQKRKVKESPKLIETICLCYLGASLMRIPVTVGDILCWVTKQEISYLRCIREIPWSMKDKLPPVYHSTLDSKTIPKGEALHRAILDMAILYHEEFGMSFPDINIPLVLFGSIRRLALPLEVFPAVNRLSKLLGYTYDLPHSETSRVRPNDFPEVRLIALLVVATQLFYPFDDIKRYPVSQDDPPALVINWNEWMPLQRMFEERETQGGKLGRGNEFKVREGDVFQMTPEQLDEYMDWYEKFWVDSKGTNPLADMFPAGRTTENTNAMETSSQGGDDEDNAVTNKLRNVLSQLKSRRAIPAEKSTDRRGNPIPRPGTSYKSYRSEDELPQTARTFYESAAKLAGVSLPTLMRVVNMAENKIRRWEEKKKNVRGKGDEGDAEGEEEVVGEDVMDVDMEG